MTLRKTSKPTAGSQKRSRGPRKPTATLLDAVTAFARLAKRRSIRWYVFGAQAVALYGVPRTTDDLDITLDLEGADFAEIAGELRRSGFSPRIANEGFASETRVYPVIHDASGWKIDLVLAGPGLEDVFLREARAVPIGKLTIPVIAPEHLVALKILASRPKDLEDVRGMLRITKLEHSRVETTLATLEALLDQSDLLPVYRRLREEVARQSRRVKRAPKSGSPKRQPR
jgi:hypothetical protein